ncbi:MAG: PEP-CTERM sorting domain-containing protein [Phycisphaerae bacterium]|nr:PEP-CTERM sorting domain-containing protein [Phycisphaerae bacterium]
MRRLVVILICFTSTSVASAAFVTGFESSQGYVGSAAGIGLSGQQGWYTPDVAGSVDGYVYTYADNPYGVPQNPYGGAQFFGGRAMGDDAYARSQHDYNWAAESIVRISYDFCAKFTGTLPAVDNVGSWSMQPSGSVGGPEIYMQSLYTWADTAGGTAIHAGYLIDENPAAPPAFPGPEWQNLPVDHWFRQTVLVNMEYFKIIECTIQDLTIGGPVTVAHPENWHFINYAVAGGTLPTGFRCFTGGTTAGNFLAWDNFSIPEPATIALLLIGFAALRRR